MGMIGLVVNRGKGYEIVWFGLFGGKRGDREMEM
jgi:hypothetical protein